MGSIFREIQHQQRQRKIVMRAKLCSVMAKCHHNTTICYCNQLRCAVICFYMMPTIWSLCITIPFDVFHSISIVLQSLLFYLSYSSFFIKCEEIDIVLFWFRFARMCMHVALIFRNTSNASYSCYIRF